MTTNEAIELKPKIGILNVDPDELMSSLVFGVTLVGFSVIVSLVVV